jgi:hypothetical protein
MHMRGEGRHPVWTWSELPRFAKFCRDVCKKLEIPYEDSFDKIRWAIEETLCWEPIVPSHPDPRFDDDVWRYFHTDDAPAQTPLPPLVVTFRIAHYPRFGELGLLEGREVWIEEDLRRIGFELREDA